jgi:hypothetical protein
MKLKTTYGLTVLLATLYSCSNPKTDNVVIEERVAIPKTASEKLFNQLRPESQKFQINAELDNSITGKNGTLVFVPKNSFIDADGELVTGKVDIELIEVLSVADFVKTNLQTVSNGLLLQSEGMLYMDAKSDGQQITLATGKKIQIELPSVNNSNTLADIKIFSGSYDDKGNINWTESGKLENRLIPLPLELLNHNFWVGFFDNLSHGVRHPFLAQTHRFETDSTIFKQKKFENTFIATREFEERSQWIQLADWVISCYPFHFETAIKGGEIRGNSTITQIYMNNLEQDLWYCDSLAHAYMKTFEDTTNLYASSVIKEDTTFLSNLFKQFYEQRLTTVIVFPPDIDLSKKDAREKLASKGFTEVEIDELLGAYERQNKIEAARRNEKEIQSISTNSFAVAKLGWINCDQFYDDPTAKESNLVASVNNMGSYEFATLSLIINGRRIALNGTPDDKFNYSFTGGLPPYTKLPIGERATIIGLSYKNDTPYIGIKEIVIGEKGNYTIDLQASSVKDINTKLSGIQ